MHETVMQNGTEQLPVAGVTPVRVSPGALITCQFRQLSSTIYRLCLRQMGFL